MFSNKDFQDWAKDNVVLFASIMTRIEGRKDDALLSDYGFRGFPSLALLDSKGEIITKKVNRDLPSMKEVTKNASAYVTLKAKVDAGEEVDKAEWLMARMGMGLLSVDEAKEAMAEVELSDAQADKMDTMLVVLEVETMLNQARNRGPEASQHPAMIYKMWKSNRKLPNWALARRLLHGDADPGSREAGRRQGLPGRLPGGPQADRVAGPALRGLPQPRP